MHLVSSVQIGSCELTAEREREFRGWVSLHALHPCLQLVVWCLNNFVSRQFLVPIRVSVCVRVCGSLTLHLSTAK